MGASGPQLASARQQAPEGADVYGSQCADCHGKNGGGGPHAPPLMGPKGLPLHGHDGDSGPFATAQDVFGYVKAQMPLPKSHAGTLSDAQYWAVTNYILAGKGVKLPSSGATAANAASIVANAQ
jgi:mono/diheme cytochrome c family protein